MGPAIRGESGRGEVRDDVDVDFVAMLLRGETRVHDGDRASGAEAAPAAGPRADYRLRLTLDQWTPDGAVSGEITERFVLQIGQQQFAQCPHDEKHHQTNDHVNK